MRAAALLAVALTATGCAGQTLSPEQDAVGTVSTFLVQCSRDRPLAVLPVLVPAAQRGFTVAGGAAKGCARILRLGRAVPAPRDFAAAKPRLRSFTGGHAVVTVAIAGRAVPLELSYGEGFWRIEGA